MDSDALVDDLTHLAGHNVSATTTATIGFRLTLAAGGTCRTAMSSGLQGEHARTELRRPVVQWDSATKTYKTYVVGLPLNDFNIVASAGYWIYAASAKTLTLQGSVPTVQQTKAITVPTGGGGPWSACVR